MQKTHSDVEYQKIHIGEEKLFTDSAVHFLSNLHRKFNQRRQHLLQQRKAIQKQIDEGILPTFPKETESVRKDTAWKVGHIPKDLQKRWVEITGPTERKMMINAFNSGADVFMADFEDANAPTWHNMLEGQLNLIDATKGQLRFTSPEGKEYKLNEKIAVLMVRPRGWHLEEKHFKVDGEPISGALFDFGLTFFHNAKQLIKNGSGPYFYLPKLESYQEARLWNEVFIYAQETLGIPRGTIRATVLIETILAALQMEEILYELREHSAGLNAGRWDYIFSIIKKFQKNKNFNFPDRIQVSMTVPFMRAYTKHLVRTCHKRGASAMGGMAAYIPNRKDPAINDVALSKVREDKIRESKDGFDGTWVAHPDLVPIAHEIFEMELKGKANQIQKIPPDENITPKEILEFTVPGGKITEEGVRQNIRVSLQYLTAWLSGLGAVAINNLMEDAATAEISRAQLWQWIHHPHTKMDSGKPVNKELYNIISQEEFQKLEQLFQDKKKQLLTAKHILDSLVLDENFADFLTLKGYEHLTNGTH